MLFLHYFLQKASESVVKVKPKNREVLLGNGFEKLQTVSNQISESTLALQRLRDVQKKRYLVNFKPGPSQGNNAH